MTIMILFSDCECNRAPGKDDFNLTWPNFSIFDLIIYELGYDLRTG